jgi:iron complex outermembrane receptor protein
MKNNVSSLLAGLSMISLGVATTDAFAQGTINPADKQSAGSPAPDSSSLGDIIVTAQKRAENLQDVPISVAAVTSVAIESLHATNLQALQGTVPNVQINNYTTTPTSAVYTIRGIGIIEPYPYAGNTVSIVVDGLPQYFSLGALADIYDVERIEILRGPQGTLFGANTTGGVVNVVNAQPTKELGGKVDLSYGNYHRIQAGGVLNVPFDDNLAARFVVSHDQRDGFITNVVNGKDLGRRNVTLFRGAIKYSPGSNFDATLSGEYDRTRNGAPVVVQGAVPGETAFVPVGFRNMYASPCAPAGSRCVAADKYLAGQVSGPTDANGNVVDPIRDIEHLDTFSGTLTMNIRDTAVGDITSITGYKHFVDRNYTDQSGTSVFGADTKFYAAGWQASQEIRTAIDVSDKIKLQIGGFYLKDHYRLQSDLRFNLGAPVKYNAAANTVTYGFPGFESRNLENQNNYSISGFAQTYVSLTDKLRLQAGIRYSHEQTKMLASTLNSVSPTGITTFSATAPDGTPNISLGTVAPPLGVKSWNNVGWKVGFDYKPVDRILLYGYWARGFKSGGFTGRIQSIQDLGPYDPEKVDTFEAGIKSDLLDRRLRFNLTGFYTNYRQMQLAVIGFKTDPVTGAVLQTNGIINAASSHLKGFEAELAAVPVHGLTLEGSLAYLDAKYSNFLFVTSAGTTMDLTGQRLQNAPKWTSSVSATYEFPIADMTARLRAQYNYQSEKLLSNIVDTPRSRVQPQHIVNANADLVITSNLKIGIYSTNLLNKHYINAANDFPGLLGPVSYAPPRQFGISAGYTF